MKDVYGLQGTGATIRETADVYERDDLSENALRQSRRPDLPFDSPGGTG